MDNPEKRRNVLGMTWLSSGAAACLLLVLTGCSAAPTAHVPDDVDMYNIRETPQPPHGAR
jgi:hypothetical protein